MSISVWMRDREQRESVGSLPQGVELNLIPNGSAPPAGILDAEFLVPPYARGEPLANVVHRAPKATREVLRKR